PRWALWTRVQLLFVALAFVLVMISWQLANALSKLLNAPRLLPPADVLVTYVGDVKLYQDDCRPDLWPLEDMNVPPRVAIRRRVVRALVDMANAGYERWYVLAHSLGTVVALNGLMEREEALPNYLDEERWNQCREKGLTES